MSKFAGLGIAAIGAEEPYRMVILHPITNQPLKINGAPEGEDEAYIDILSSDSETARKHHRSVGNARISRRTRSKTKFEEYEQSDYELLAKLTKGWRLATLDGAPIDLPATYKNALELYQLPDCAWLMEQVNTAAADRALFLKASSTSS